MIEFKIGKQKVSIPTDWSELTLSQAIGLADNKDGDIIRTISIITGLDYEICYRLRSGDVEALLVPCLTFLNESFDQDRINDAKPPDTFTINGKTFSKYYSPGAMIYAQHLNLQALIADTNKRDIDKLAPCIAICCQKPETYNEDEQKRLENGAGWLPIYTAYSIAGFFFAQWQTFSNLQNSRKNLTTLMSRFGRASKSSPNLAHSIP